MITNETEVRVAIQAVLATVLVLYGFWGCAIVLLIILLPWKPILAVGGYLAQPVVDWRLRKAREHHEEGITKIERELDDILRAPKAAPRSPAPLPATNAGAAAKAPQSPTPQPMESFRAIPPAAPVPQEIPATAENLAATLAIPRIIESHVRDLPQGAFSNMDLEVERLEFHGDTTAEAYVKFCSPSVSELVVRQRYVLRKSGEQWQVESRQPANGCGKVPTPSFPAMQPPMRLT